MGNEFRRRIVTGDDQDVHTGWRRVMCRMQRAGAAATAKRATRRRERRELATETRKEARDG